LNPTASFYKLGKVQNVNHDSNQLNAEAILQVKQQIDKDNLNSVINRDLLMQFADWGFDLESIQLMSKSAGDINQDNIEQFLNLVDCY